MSDGLHNLVGKKKITRQLGGRSLTFCIMVLGDHAEKEQYILSLKPDPLTAATRLPASTPPAMRSAVIESAMRLATRPQFVTRGEEQEFDESLHGIAWALWRALRDNQPEFGQGGQIYVSPSGISYGCTPATGVQKVLDLIEEVGNEHMQMLLDIRDGVEEKTELGN